MKRIIFPAVLALVAGVCLGVMGTLTLIDTQTLSLPANTTISTSVSPSVSDALLVDSSDLTAAVTPEPSLDTEENRILLSQAFDVAAVLAQRDYQALSTYVHPVEGVLFTPYSTVEPEANLTFTPAQVAKLEGDDKSYVWGIIDGKGDPLELTAEAYFDCYVYNADYLQAPLLGIDRVIGSGNALENVGEAFPDCRFVEFYFPGLEPEYEGFDWCGLKLVFSEYRGEYKLRAVIHSEWTI